MPKKQKKTIPTNKPKRQFFIFIVPTKHWTRARKHNQFFVL